MHSYNKKSYAKVFEAMMQNYLFIHHSLIYKKLFTCVLESKRKSLCLVHALRLKVAAVSPTFSAIFLKWLLIQLGKWPDAETLSLP